MNPTTQHLLGAAGAVVGAALGVVLFVALAKIGLLAHVAIGFGAGLGAQRAFPGRSQAMGALTAAIALLATVGTEWAFFPFAKDESLAFFVANLFELPSGTLIMIALSVAVAYWMGQGRGGAA